jgi:hypothetical protein
MNLAALSMLVRGDVRAGEMRIQVEPVDDAPQLLLDDNASAVVLRCGLDSSVAVLLTAREADGQDLYVSVSLAAGLGSATVVMGALEAEGQGTPARRARVRLNYAAPDCAQFADSTGSVALTVVATDSGGLTSTLSVPVTVQGEDITRCPAGSRLASSNENCELCPVGTIRPAGQSLRLCSACSLGSVVSGNRTAGVTCERDLSLSWDPLIGKCSPCPANANCSGGALVTPRAGYFHSGLYSFQFHRCLSAGACDYAGRDERLMEYCGISCNTLGRHKL